MRAMVLQQRCPIELNPLALAEVPRPEPGGREVLVKVEVCGICRTDLHVVEGELPAVRASIVPGHQVIGTVERCGDSSKRFRRGDRVGIAWLRYTCGQCRYCLSGSENLCREARFTGYHENGGFADYAVVHEDFAYPIPSELEAAADTPLLCAGI